MTREHRGVCNRDSLIVGLCPNLIRPYRQISSQVALPRIQTPHMRTGKDIHSRFENLEGNTEHN